MAQAQTNDQEKAKLAESRKDQEQPKEQTVQQHHEKAAEHHEPEATHYKEAVKQLRLLR